MAHRSKVEKKEVTLFAQCVTEGNGRAAVLAKDGAMLEWRRSGSDQSQNSLGEKREEVYAATQLRSWLSLVDTIVKSSIRSRKNWVFVDKKVEA